MKPKYFLVVLIVIIILITGYIYLQNLPEPVAPRSYPSSSNITLYSIPDFKRSGLRAGNVNIEWYVVKIYTCPPCPKGAVCSICMKENILVSENNKLLEMYDLTQHELIIFADNPKQFELGKKYRFSVKVLDYKTTLESINDVELTGYDLLD